MPTYTGVSALGMAFAPFRSGFIACGSQPCPHVARVS